MGNTQPEVVVEAIDDCDMVQSDSDECCEPDKVEHEIERMIGAGDSGISHSTPLPVPETFPEQNYDWGEKILGMGELSVVHSASSVVTGKQVAIKRISPKQLNHRRVQQLYKEASILNKLDNFSSNNNHFVKLIEGFIDHQGGICLVTDRIPGTELFELFAKSPNGIPEQQAKMIIRQILIAVNELHSNNIAHLDLKLENIMHDASTDKINIIDFGFAEETSTIDLESGKPKQKLLTSFCGSLEYSAPEILQHKPFDGKRADVWSLGVIVFALLSGNFPFCAPRRQKQQTMQKIVIGKYSMPDHVSPQAASFIRRMLQKYPDNRSNVASLLQHPWLRSGNECSR